MKSDVVLPCLALSFANLHSLVNSPSPMNLHSSNNCATLEVQFSWHLSQDLPRLLCYCQSVSEGSWSCLLPFSCVLLPQLFRSHTWPLRGHMHYDRHYRTLYTPRRTVRQLCDSPHRNTYCYATPLRLIKDTPITHNHARCLYIQLYDTPIYSYKKQSSLNVCIGWPPAQAPPALGAMTHEAWQGSHCHSQTHLQPSEESSHQTWTHS